MTPTDELATLTPVVAAEARLDRRQPRQGDDGPEARLGHRPPRRGDDGALAAVGYSVAAMYGGWAAFQVALVAGAPLGDHVWGGGQSATLPAGMRIAGGVAAAVLIWMLTVVLARADLTRLRPVPRGRLRIATWAIAGYMALNTLGNLASQSSVEQLLFAPITAVMTALTVVVAVRGRRP